MRKVMVGLVLLFAGSLAPAQAGHPPNLVEVAHELDRTANWTYRNIAARSQHFGHDHRRHAARNLARAADRFHHNVERGAPLVRLSRDLQRVERHYHDLNRQLAWGPRYGAFAGAAHHDLRKIGRLLNLTRRSMAAEHHRYGRRGGWR